MGPFDCKIGKRVEKQLVIYFFIFFLDVFHILLTCYGHFFLPTAQIGFHGRLKK